MEHGSVDASESVGPPRRTGTSSGIIVLAILVAALILAGTLVLIDVNRASRCERYGRNVLAFYQQQSDLEASAPGREPVSRATLTAALLETVGYPPPGCALP
jgi:hypothetical protein